MIRRYKFILMIIPALLIAACQEKFELDATPPSVEEASFTAGVDSQGANYYTFENLSNGFIKDWNFGNGTTGEGDKVTAYFPFAGEYVVTLTVYNAGGSTQSSQTITITDTDPEICNVEVLKLLTGGCGDADGKTWVVDSDRNGHFGLGPVTATDPIWYAAAANEKIGGGMYDDEFTFFLDNSKFDWVTNGDIYLNGGQATNYPGSYESPVGDYTAPFDAPDDLTYSLSSDGSGNQFINLSKNAFLGYATGVSKFQILSISENELYVKFLDAASAEFSWFIRLIPKGYAPLGASFSATASGLTVSFNNTSVNADSYLWDFGDGNTSTEANPVHTYETDGTYDVTLTATAPGQEATVTSSVTVVSVIIAFPINFEVDEINFGGFGGTVFNVIDNPDASGVNTSSKVGEYVKGFDGNWAGIEVTLADDIDFSSNTTLAMKVWSPVTGRALFKIEDPVGGATAVEVFADITKTNEWEQLVFDFSGVASNTYNKIALFMDFDNNNGGTFYLDDIGFGDKPVITLEELTGGGTKAWTLKQDASGFGVGPAPGDVQWFSAGPGDRPCLFNDEFVFSDNGQYEYKTNGDIFGEEYMGLEVGCQSEENLDGTDAAAWGSGLHSFSLSPGTSSSPAYLTVIGTGAFIALPKAYNGGEYTVPPPATNGPITYTIYEYDSVNEELKLTIDVGGGVYWSYILVPSL